MATSAEDRAVLEARAGDTDDALHAAVKIDDYFQARKRRGDRRAIVVCALAAAGALTSKYGFGHPLSTWEMLAAGAACFVAVVVARILP